MAGWEGKTRLRRRMSGSTRVVQRPVQLFSASSATSWASRWLQSWEFRQGTEDLAKAFRQVPLHNDSLRYNVVCAWSPEAAKWQFFQMLAMPFGLKAAVLQFNRVSALVTALARRVLGIPCLGFYDDFKHSELLASVPSARNAFTDLVAWLGLTDPQKSQDPTLVVKFLGTLEDASGNLGADSFALCPTPERIQTVHAELLRVRGAPVLHLGELARLRGKLIHLAGTMAGRVGASLTYQCTYHITKGHHYSFLGVAPRDRLVFGSPCKGTMAGGTPFYASPGCHCHL